MCVCVFDSFVVLMTEEDKYIFVGYLDGIYDEKYEVSTKEKVESGDGTVSA